MTLHVHKKSPARLQHFLQGGILGGSIKSVNGVAKKYYGLTGKTLIFTAPLGTVTFTAIAGQDYHTPQDVKAQVEAQVITLKVTFPESYIAVNLVVPAIGVNLNSTGTANQLLGFSVNKITKGVFYNAPGGGVPELITVYPIDQGRIHVITDE